ncbi:Sec7 domain-containing protein [Radiomyces spectabilis]|uniref:Sec7 domain-containing protein n=1 Tax=Radiomyces spectabilis TaxID=64574 RepID=UPI00221FD436|nr:Sec7 domain-containing protein [Radiomyces spectabilis]KAI8373101.1 Sec7 domain-containing protein [Radiomyces spectabilis]
MVVLNNLLRAQRSRSTPDLFDNEEEQLGEKWWSEEIASSPSSISATVSFTSTNVTLNPKEMNVSGLSVARILPPVRSSSLSSTNTSSAPTPCLSTPTSDRPTSSSSHSTTDTFTTAEDELTYCSSRSSLSSLSPDDEVKSLLEWKRQSVLGNLFSTRLSLWDKNAIFGHVEELMKQSSQQEAQAMADKLWSEDETTIKLEKIAAYLGRFDPFCHNVLQLYLEKFDFTHMSLDDAFRKLCDKLYFKAEAQEIDRILESFARRYWECNHHSLFGNADIVYAVTYSMMLLNTDLHIVHGSGHIRMTRSEFCQNTMRTVLDHLNSARATTPLPLSLAQWQNHMEQCLKDIYSSIKQRGVLQANVHHAIKTKPTILQRMGSLKQRKQENSAVFEPEKSSKCFEGYLIWKESSEHLWHECFATLDHGYLRLHAQTKRISPIHLGHALAAAVAIDDCSFVLHTIPSKTYLFACATSDDRDRWMHQCNYWAARDTKVPLPVGIKHTDYQQPSHGLDTWTVPAAPAPNVRSFLNTADQHEAIRNHLKHLQEEYEQHQELRTVLTRKLTNWQAKQDYLSQEMQKYTCYDLALEQGKQRSEPPSLLDIGLGDSLFEEINAELQLSHLS